MEIIYEEKNYSGISRYKYGFLGVNHNQRKAENIISEISNLEDRFSYYIERKKNSRIYRVFGNFRPSGKSKEPANQKNMYIFC